MDPESVPDKIPLEDLLIDDLQFHDLSLIHI